MVNTVDSSLYLSANQANRKETETNILGKDDFLKLLMAQLKHQDPLNPMEDMEYISQMAQFSSLEQMTNINTAVDKLVNAQEQSMLHTYSQFIGKEINWQRMVTSDGEPTIEEGRGRVTALQFENGQVSFLLEDGTAVGPGNISQINEQTGDNQLVQASMLIGKTVTYVNDKKEELKEEVKSVVFKDGKINFLLADELNTAITGSQITKIE